MATGVVVLGSTGSIGESTLDVLALNNSRYRVVALTANTSADKMIQQCIKWRPQYAVLSDADAAQKVEQGLKQSCPDTKVLSGVEGLTQIASLESVEIVVAGIVGAAGLVPTLAAAKAGKKILLANKEALVMSGQLFMDTVKENNASLLPVDSEHNALFQCMPDGYRTGYKPEFVNKIMLTASGGPFRTTPVDELARVTPEQAVAHPNWVMGRKISVDSASMMNKGLEVIEAHWLFQLSADEIQVVIHPQSIVHSLVQYIDGSVLAQLGSPDMKTPIANALSWPERMESGVEPLDLFEVAKLEFERPDFTRFRCLDLCYQALRAGGSASTVLNAANEVAVNSFLSGKIRFTDIAKIIEQTLADISDSSIKTINEILDIDDKARSCAEELILKSGH